LLQILDEYGSFGDKAGDIIPSVCYFFMGFLMGALRMLEDPISKCLLRKLGPFFIGSQLAMETIVLCPVTVQGKKVY
jgi:hypothetical protein